MNDQLNELNERVSRPPRSANVAEGLLIAGLAVIAIYAISAFSLIGVDLQYFENAKSVRDAADAGSGILAQLRTLESTRAWLEPAFFAGLALIVFGIGISFAVSILNMVKLRAHAARELLLAVRHR